MGFPRHFFDCCQILICRLFGKGLPRLVNDAATIRRIPWTLIGTAVVLFLIGLSAIARGDALYNLGEFAPRQRIWAVMGLGVFVVGAS